jgi:hypothetical protein
MEHINTLCGQNAEFYYVKAGGTYSDHGVKGLDICLLEKGFKWKVLSHRRSLPRSVTVSLRSSALYILHGVRCRPSRATAFRTRGAGYAGLSELWNTFQIALRI